MGRPLYFQTPAVRVEPEQPQPSYEKWTYWNPFDPDADEFFENEEAVYEAVVDPSTIRVQATGDGERPRSVLVEDSSSSESSSSGRGSPMSETGDISVEEIDLAMRRRQAQLVQIGQAEEAEEERMESAGVVAETRSRDTPLVYTETTQHARTYQPSDMVSASLNMYNLVSTSAPPVAIRSRILPPPSHRISLPEAPPEADSPLPLPRPSPLDDRVASRAAEVSISPRGVSLAEPVDIRPSTPPNQIHSFYTSPSPAPTVTPRLYSWSTRTPSYMVSPIAGGPLTNHSARLSVAHLTPSSPSPAIAVHRVVG